MENEEFTLDTAEGSITCSILQQIYSEKYQKNYLVYTDQTTDELNQQNIFISSINEEKNDMLEDITDDVELKEMNEALMGIWEVN